MQEKCFNKYKNSFNEYRFKDIVLNEFIGNIKNPHYYYNYIEGWHNQRFEELNNNEVLRESTELLSDFLINLKFLMISIIELYITIERCDNRKSVRINKVHIKQNKVLEMFQALEEIKINIQLNGEKGRNDLAVKTKNYCLNKLDEVKLLFRNNLYIDIDKSPLKKEFSKLIKSIKKTVNESNINTPKKERKKEFDYLKITTLFAQGFIYSESSKEKIGKIYSYKNKRFNSILDLKKHLNKDILKGVNFRQYLEDTLNESKGKKDIYFNKTIYNNTYNHCLTNNIEMTDLFKSKYDKFNN